MRIGVRVPQYGSTWPEVRDAALLIERLGFDGIWVNDHLQSPGRHANEPAFDALTTLSALAALTNRARLGVAVLSASYRPPALAAKMTTVLDVISSGRLVVGLGTGSDRAEHAAYGYPFGSRAERTAGLLATLDTMERMCDSPDGPMPNQPVARPPIWLAAHKPKLLRLAGERADGVVAAFLPPAELAARRAIAEHARLAAGRPAMAWCLYTFIWPLGPDSDSWLAAEAAALDTTPRAIVRWLETTGIVAPADEIADRLAEYADAGATDAVLAVPSRVPLEVVCALADALPMVGG
jgi:alkanesulfonate monooxygenase SsuD/methylene tetrahydromethanopterin reductase-like flavin-dependent oxidoreductase (luciferase family)